MSLRDLATTWGSFYANHTSVKTIVMFAHLGGLLAGGGTAIAADRAILRRGNDPAARPMLLEMVASSHRVVIASLAAIIASGVLLFASDVDTFLYSRVFWLKMTLVMTLLSNGAALQRGEHRAVGGDEGGWRLLRLTAIVSITVWALTTFVGVALSNIG